MFCLCFLNGRQLSAEDPSAEHGIPESIVTAWQQAVKPKSKSAKNALFAAFLKAGKNWGKLLGLDILVIMG